MRNFKNRLVDAEPLFGTECSALAEEGEVAALRGLADCLSNKARVNRFQRIYFPRNLFLND